MRDQATSKKPKTVYLKDYQPPHYWVDEILLRFELNETATLVKSVLKIRQNPHYAGKLEKAPLLLNGDDVVLIDIAIDSRPLTSSDYVQTEEGITLMDVPSQFILSITTKINPKENSQLSGLYLSGKSFCTQCEAEGFRRITYFIDRPDVLSLYTTTIVGESSLYPHMLSNGNLIDQGVLEDGRHYVTFQDPFKKPSYLFALVAGDFDVLRDRFITKSNREVTLALYVEKGFLDQTQHAMSSLKEAMRWDEESYGREYDLDIYMLVAISDFNMGAMENKGLNIFNSKYILAKPETATDDDYIHISSVIAHEYFHNWTGNRITCRDWFQLSLKEGLTIFRDQSFTADMLGSVARIYDVRDLREVQFPEDAGPLSHPVRPASYIEINNFYTATVYNKGAEVLRMLQTLLGKAMFRKGMDLYFSRYDGQAVTIEDFIAVMETVSSFDLTQFRLWYVESGTPQISIDEDYNPSLKHYTLRIQQSLRETDKKTDTSSLLVPIRVSLFDESGKAITLMLENEEPASEKVLQLKTKSSTFTFLNVEARPIPSLLRGFSAPVKLRFPYSDNDLLFLAEHDNDPFNRCEAIDRYAKRVMLRLIKDYRQNETLSVPPEFLHLIGKLLASDLQEKEPILLATMLSLPSEKYLGEEMEVIDVDAVHFVREHLLTVAAKHWQTRWLEVYKRYTTTVPYHFSREEAGKRYLKNCCLRYLLQLPDPSLQQLGVDQFNASLASNMTDTLAALRGLSQIDSPTRGEVLAMFYEKWQEDPLVVDKWFEIQAASKLPNTLSEVKKLMRHKAFNIKNPNKVHALIGTFCYRNPYHFHQKNGEGYAFLRSCVQTLDALNPQVASRMVKPLTTFRRYDVDRQQLMRQQLEIILEDSKLSNDVYEMVSKALQ